MLAVGVAMGRNPGATSLLQGEADERLDEARPTRSPERKVGAKTQAPGVSLASPLAKLTSHSR